jgi:hypothetical protein
MFRPPYLIMLLAMTLNVSLGLRLELPEHCLTGPGIYQLAPKVMGRHYQSNSFLANKTTLSTRHSSLSAINHQTAHQRTRLIQTWPQSTKQPPSKAATITTPRRPPAPRLLDLERLVTGRSQTAPTEMLPLVPVIQSPGGP